MAASDDIPGEVTALLERMRGGDLEAEELLFSLTYDELRVLARGVMRGSRDGVTLQPTAVVHEAWLKLVGNIESLEGRRHFFATAARAMRQILADHARAQKRQKRGGGAKRVSLEGHAARKDSAIDLVAFHECLEALTRSNERQARVVELRLLGALTLNEAAEILGISPSTVKADWNSAKSWLARELGYEP